MHNRYDGSLSYYDAASRRHGNEELEKLTGDTVTKEVFIAHYIAQKFPTLAFEYDDKATGGLVFDGSAPTSHMSNSTLIACAGIGAAKQATDSHHIDDLATGLLRLIPSGAIDSIRTPF